jgi:hypothetical protein
MDIRAQEIAKNGDAVDGARRGQGVTRLFCEISGF